jgi:uncharacterized integral membrane protein
MDCPSVKENNVLTGLYGHLVLAIKKIRMVNASMKENTSNEINVKISEISGVKEMEQKEETTKQKQKKKANRKNKILLGLLFLFLFSVIAVKNVSSMSNVVNFFTSLFHKEAPVQGEVDTTDQEIRAIHSDSVSSVELSTSVEEEQQRLNAIAENSRVYCIISSSPYFSSAKEKGTLYISNPKESIYYTQVIIKTKDTEKEMYVSPLLAPEDKIEQDYLTDQSFAKGSYKANAYFNYYSKIGNTGTEKDYTYIGTMCGEIELIID